MKLYYSIVLEIYIHFDIYFPNIYTIDFDFLIYLFSYFYYFSDFFSIDKDLLSFSNGDIPSFGIIFMTGILKKPDL